MLWKIIPAHVYITMCVAGYVLTLTLNMLLHDVLSDENG